MIFLIHQYFLLGLVFLSAVTFAEESIKLVEEWSIENQFSMPESAAFDPVGQQIYVSNVNVYAKDGNGFISQVSADGNEVNLNWLSGLNSPTGLTVHEGLLYAVDYDQLLVIDIKSHEILIRAKAPHEKPALNDVALSESGQVFVSGSSSKSIYTLEGEYLKVWKQDDALLKHANGLLVDGPTLVYGGTKWLAFDLRTKDLKTTDLEPVFSKVNPPIAEIDGIAEDSCGGYFITLIDDDRLWRVNSKGQAGAVSEELIKGIDIDYFDGRLYVPTVGGGLSVFKVAMTDCLGD